MTKNINLIQKGVVIPKKFYVLKTFLSIIEFQHKIFLISTTKHKNLLEERNAIMMKGIRNIVVILLVIAALSCALEACKEKENTLQPADQNHAVLEVVLPSGKTKLYQSYNGSGTEPGEEQCYKNPAKVSIKAGETIDITFKCDDCGKEIESEIDRAGTYYLGCDCPEDGIGTGRYKEYVCLIVEIT